MPCSSVWDRGRVPSGWMSGPFTALFRASLRRKVCPRTIRTSCGMPVLLICTIMERLYRPWPYCSDTKSYRQRRYTRAFPRAACWMSTGKRIPTLALARQAAAKARSKKAESRNTVHGGRTNESRLEDCGTPWVLARECATALASRQKCQSFLRNKNADTPPPF
jgi:hypothetical protein